MITRFGPSMDFVKQGNGAHAWSFFEAPVAANLARKRGAYLLRETISRRRGAVARAEEIRKQTVEYDEEALRCLAERKELRHLLERAR